MDVAGGLTWQNSSRMRLDAYGPMLRLLEGAHAIFQPEKDEAANGKTPTPFNVAFTTHNDGVCPAAGILLALDFKQCTGTTDTACMRCDDYVTGKNCRCVPNP